MVRLAVPDDTQRLKEIWALCFEDSAEYIDLYFTYRFRPGTMMVFEETDISAMLSMLPLTLCTSRETYPAAYIYAVATHPDYQRRGICGQLLAKTHDYLKQQGVALSILVPSSKELFSYYRRYAYDKQLDVFEQKFLADDLPATSGKHTSLSLQDFSRHRQAFLSNLSDRFVWDEAALDYQLRVSTMSGGVFYLETENQAGHPNYTGYVVAEKYGDTVYLKETSFPQDQLEKAAGYTLQVLGGTSCVVRAPAIQSSYTLQSSMQPFVRPFALASCYEEISDLSEAYLSLVLD